MARDVNRYESVLLDKMIELRKDDITDGCADREGTIITLLDCIVDFREQPGGTPVEDGCGALVDKGAK